MSLAADLVAVLTFQAGFNTAVVAAGAAAFGAAAGCVGTFAMLRRRALATDALAHATLPGVAGAFLVAAALGAEGRSYGVLAAGALVAAVLAAGVLHLAATRTRLTEDSATAAVLAGFFAFGVVLMSIVQALPRGGQAGLESYLLGATAGMLTADAVTLAVVAAAVGLVVAAVYKELKAIAFDAEAARSIGLPVAGLDLLVTALVLVVVVAGLRVVGLVLVVALVVIPPAAARFWSHRLSRVLMAAMGIGAVSAFLGAAISAVVPDTPTGAVIVLVAFTAFAASAVLGPARGLVARLLAAEGPR